jgi:tRNA nucleotidyltransferase (CCA-adding enzyme)
MLRGIRFAGQLRFAIEQDTLAAIREKAPTIVNVSAERIRTELTKLLISDGADRLMLVRETGMSAYILPELDDMLDTAQNNPHHCYDVGHHVLETVQQVNRLWREKGQEGGTGEKKAHIWLAYAALLHDVAKPDCKTVDDEGIDHFYNHSRLGKEKARAVLHRLKFDNDTVSVVTRLIEHHDCRHENCFINGAYSTKGKHAMRRLMNRMGTELMPYLFLLQEADLLAQSSYKQEEKLQKLEAAKRCYREICEAADAVTVKELAVDGRDLMELGVKPGPEIGRILRKLLEEVMENPSENKKEKLIALAKKEQRDL